MHWDIQIKIQNCLFKKYAAINLRMEVSFWFSYFQLKNMSKRKEDFFFF